jgi:hypothetical protein
VPTTRHSMIIVAVLAALAIPLGTEVARGASDDDGPTCSAASLQGAYGLTGQGYLGRVPLAFVGVAVFDGKGHFRGHHDENIGTATDAGGEPRLGTHLQRHAEEALTTRVSEPAGLVSSDPVRREPGLCQETGIVPGNHESLAKGQ